MQKAIQCCWLSENRKEWAAGWLSLKFHLMSWALSGVSLSKFFSQTMLVADDAGGELLINQLKLPYTESHSNLQDLQNPFPDFWVLKKLHSYALQNESFLHLDSDAYLFSPLPSSLLSLPLFAQNYEYDHPCYSEAYEVVKTQFLYQPSYIQKTSDNRIPAANAGLIGGQDFAFFKYFEKKVWEFLERNQANLHKVNVADFNIFLEQSLFQMIANEHRIKVSYLLDYEVGTILNYGLDKFIELPSNCGYIHLMNYKRNPTACEQMAQRLWLESPELYERCERVARQLEATHHAVSMPQPSTLPDFFYRTKEVLQTVASDFILPTSSQDFISTLGLYYESMPESTEKAVLNDVFQFETEKQDFIVDLPDETLFRKRWQKYSQKVNQTLSVEESSFVQRKVKQSNFCKRIWSEWNWAETNEFMNQKEFRNYSDNLKSKPSYYEVVLYIYLHQGTVKEHLLDAFNMLLLDIFEESMTMEQGIEWVLDEIKNFQPNANEVQIKATILERVRFFLYQGVLEFSE